MDPFVTERALREIAVSVNFTSCVEQPSFALKVLGSSVSVTYTYNESQEANVILSELMDPCIPMLRHIFTYCDDSFLSLDQIVSIKEVNCDCGEDHCIADTVFKDLQSEIKRYANPFIRHTTLSSIRENNSPINLICTSPQIQFHSEPPQAEPTPCTPPRAKRPSLLFALSPLDLGLAALGQSPQAGPPTAQPSPRQLPWQSPSSPRQLQSPRWLPTTGITRMISKMKKYAAETKHSDDFEATNMVQMEMYRGYINSICEQDSPLETTEFVRQQISKWVSSQKRLADKKLLAA